MSTVLTVFGGYPGTPVTGAARMAWRTTQALARRGHRTAFLTDCGRPPGLDSGSGPVFTSPGELASTAWAHPDLVHVYDFASPHYAETGRELARRSGARLAVTPASAPETWPDPGLVRAIGSQARTFFVLTGTEALALRSIGAPADRVARIPQAPDLVGPGAGDRFRAEHGVGGPLVLFLGRHVPAKGYALLLDAAPTVWERLPETVFAFGGPSGGPATDRPFHRYRDEGRVLRLGMVADTVKHDALAACDLLCLPSSADVFPLVFAEAWSCGRPVVSGRFAGVGEVVRDGVDGLLVDHTPHSVAAGVLRLLTDAPLRAALGRAGYRRARDELGWDQVAAAVERGCALSPPPSPRRRAVRAGEAS